MFSLLDPGYFRERAGTGSIIAIDGKTVRGSESEERKAIHVVSAWAGLMVMGCIRSIRTVKGVVATEIRYYLTTLTDVGTFTHSVRAHWGIENKLHWILDVAFREDYARNRKDHSAANLMVLRKITFNLIRLEPTEKYRKQKRSLNRKRLYASYKPDFLLTILLNL